MAVSTHTLHRSLAIALALTFLGAIALFEPHTEFALVDLLESMHLPVATLGTVAVYSELAVILCTLTLTLCVLMRHRAERRLRLHTR